MVPTCAESEHTPARITWEEKREFYYLFLASFLLDVTLAVLWSTEIEFNDMAYRRRNFSRLRYTVPLAAVVTTVVFAAAIITSIKATLVILPWSECLASLCTLGKVDFVILALIWLLVLYVTWGHCYQTKDMICWAYQVFERDFQRRLQQNMRTPRTKAEILAAIVRVEENGGLDKTNWKAVEGTGYEILKLLD